MAGGIYLDYEQTPIGKWDDGSIKKDLPLARKLLAKDGKAHFCLLNFSHYQSVEFIINKYIDNLEIRIYFLSCR